MFDKTKQNRFFTVNIKKINICLGRFMPITKGHYKMIEYGLKHNGLPTVIFMISNKKMDKKHPFSDELIQKEMDMLKKSLKGIENTVYVSSADIVKLGQWCYENNYEPQLWITGSDRLAAYKRQAENRKYQDLGHFPSSFTTLEVPRTDEDISATKVREAIMNDDLDTYKKMMPKGTEKLFDEFKEALSRVKECKISLVDYIKESKFDID